MAHEDPLVRPGAGNDFETVRAAAGGDTVEMRYYQVRDPVGAVAYVGGVWGDWGSPARDLYPRLASELLQCRIAGLRVRFQAATDLARCVEDLKLGVEFLAEQGMPSLGLVGHSAGGAVVVQAALASPLVRTVIMLSSQSYGAEGIVDLSPDCSVLLIHGLEDPVLPHKTSTFLFEIAGEPKRLELLPRTGHMLEEQSERVHGLVYDWIVRELRPGGQPVVGRGGPSNHCAG
jgi:pimeloyl-ACP methyl ester carboxylesterase